MRWPHVGGNVRSSASVATLRGCKLSHNVSGAYAVKKATRIEI